MHTRPVLEKALVAIRGDLKDTVLLIYKCHAEGVEVLGVDEGLSWIPGKGVRAMKSPLRSEDGVPLFEARLSIAKRCEFRARSWSGDVSLYEEGKNHVLERKAPGKVFLDGNLLTVEGEEKIEKEEEKQPGKSVLEELVIASEPFFGPLEPETPVELLEWVLKTTKYFLTINTVDKEELSKLAEYTRIYREYYGLTPSLSSYKLFQGFSVILQEAIYSYRKWRNKEKEEELDPEELWGNVKKKIDSWFEEWKDLDIDSLFPEDEKDFEEEKDKLLAYFNQLL